MGVVVLCRGCHCDDFTILLSCGYGFVCPASCVYIEGFVVVDHQVFGYQSKMDTCPALHKENAVVGGYIEELVNGLLGVGTYLEKGIASVGETEYRNTPPFKVEDRL